MCVGRAERPPFTRFAESPVPDGGSLGRSDAPVRSLRERRSSCQYHAGVVAEVFDAPVQIGPAERSSFPSPIPEIPSTENGKRKTGSGSHEVVVGGHPRSKSVEFPEEPSSLGQGCSLAPEVLVPHAGRREFPERAFESVRSEPATAWLGGLIDSLQGRSCQSHLLPPVVRNDMLHAGYNVAEVR